MAFVALVLIAVGCTSTVNGFYPDAGDAGSTSLVPDENKDAGKVTDAGKRKDTGTTTEEDDDAGSEDAGKPDATKKDSGVVVVSCSPESVSSFSPSWKGPKALHSSACTAANAALVVECNFDDTANQTTCANFLNDANNQNCIDCVLTPSTGSQLGPIIITNSIGALNVAGCIAALSGNATASGCGAKLQAVDQCTEASCASCTDPSTSQQAFDEYQQCQTDAQSSECATYYDDAACADDLVQPDASAANCIAGNTFLDRARNMAKLFCSP